MVDWQHLPSSARWLFHLQALIRLVVVWLPSSVFLAMFGGTALGWLFGSPIFGPAAGIALGAVWLALQGVAALVLPSLAWARLAWCLRDHDLLVSEGVLVHEVSSVPRSRVQHVDVRQGPIERTFGLARLYVYTASGAGADIVLPGLALTDAEWLRDVLVRVGGDGGV